MFNWPVRRVPELQAFIRCDTIPSTIVEPVNRCASTVCRSLSTVMLRTPLSRSHARILRPAYGPLASQRQLNRPVSSRDISLWRMRALNDVDIRDRP